MVFYGLKFTLKIYNQLEDEMLNDKWLAFFLTLGLLALAIAVPGVAGLIAALVTGIPNFWGFAIAGAMTVAFGMRYLFLYRRNNAE